MDFFDRLQHLMKMHGDNNFKLAKNSGIPYTTIDGLFKRGYQKARISTIQKICKYYGVSLDYMIYGAEKFSTDAFRVAAAYDEISNYGKSMIESILENEQRYSIELHRVDEREAGRREIIERYLSE